MSTVQSCPAVIIPSGNGPQRPAPTRSSKIHPIKNGSAEQRVSTLMQSLIEQKNQLKENAAKNRLNASEATLIGGDFFNMGYLVFSGILAAFPSAGNIPAVAGIGFACAEIGGLINIFVALICLKEGIQALKNGDKLTAFRLIVDAVGLAFIGVLMIFASLGAKIAAFSGVTTFLAANPWLLPVLFLIVTLPTFFEVTSRIKCELTKKDYFSQIDKDHLAQLINGEDRTNPFHMMPLIKDLKNDPNDETEVFKKLSSKMEQLQADMGVEGALEAFKMLKDIVDKKNAKEAFDKVKTEVDKWNRIQKIRMAQQVLYLGAFGLSMGALSSPFLRGASFQAAQSFAMAGANAIPLGLDIFEPFKRNVPIIIPKIDPPKPGNEANVS